MPTEQLVAELRADISQFRAEMSRAQRVTEEASRRMESSTKRISTGFDAMGRAARGAAGAIAAIGVVRLGQDLVQTGVRLQSLENAFKAITGSAAGARRELQFVRQESDRLGLEFVSTAQAFQGIAAAARGTSLQGAAVRESFLGVVEAAAVLGLSSDQVGGALTALSQIISKGTVQAEELRGQLGERIPGAFQIAARSMNVTTAELGKFLEQGQVTADEFLPRFGRQLRQEFGGAAQEASTRAAASFARLENSITDLKKAIVDAGFLDAVSAAAIALRRLIDSLRGVESLRPDDQIERLNRRLKELQATLDTPTFGFGLVPGERTEEERQRIQREISRIQDAIRAWKGDVDDLGTAFEQVSKAAVDTEKKAVKAAAEGTKAAEEQQSVIQQLAERDLEAFGEAWANLEDDIEEGKRAAEEFERQMDTIIDQRQDLNDLSDAWANLERDIESGKRAAEQFEREQARIVEQRARLERRALEESQRRIDQFSANVLERALRGNISDVADFFRDTFFSVIAQIAARAATTQIIMPIIPTVFGGGGVGGVASAGSLLGGLPNIGGFLGTRLPGFLGGRSPLAFGSPRGSELLAGNIPGAGATIGQTLGAIGIGFAGAQILRGLLPLPNQGSLGAQVGNFGGAGVGALGGLLLGGPLGAGIGAGLGSLLGSVFGGLFGGRRRNPIAAFRTSGARGGFEDIAGLSGPFGFVGLSDELSRRVNGAELGQFVLEADRFAARILTDRQERMAAATLQLRQTGVQLEFREFDDVAARFLADRFTTVLEAITPSDLAKIIPSAFSGIDLTAANIPQIQARFQELAGGLAAIEQMGDILGQDVVDEALSGAQSLADALQTLAEAVQIREQIEQAVSAIDSQIAAMLDAIQTPATIFERRLDEIAVLEGQLAGAGPQEALRIAAQIQSLAGSAFQLASGGDVLGQDETRLRLAQNELVDVLRSLRDTLSGLPSFQGLTSPITFSRPTLAAVHTGETLLPASGGGSVFESGAIVIHAAPGQNAELIADTVIRRIEERGRFDQTRISIRR